MTVSGWLEHWLTTIAVQRIKPTTYQGYESKIRAYLVPQLGHHRLDRLEPEHLEQAYARLIASGLSPSTVLVCHRIISRALKVALQRKRVSRNVATLVDAPTAQTKQVVPLTVDEALRVLAAATGQRNAARWSVALALGLRQGEALGARWSDVDLDTGTWHVRQQTQRLAYRHGCRGACRQQQPRHCPQRTGGRTFTTPKTKRGQRVIGLPPQLVDALRAHRQEQVAERLAGPLWQDHDLVFAQPDGQPYDGKQDWYRWKALLGQAGVRDARVHDARHTAATLLLAQHVPPRVVMEVLGHSTIAVTLNIYGHVMPEVVTAATSAVADVLWATSTPPAEAPSAAQATTLAPRRTSRAPSSQVSGRTGT